MRDAFHAALRRTLDERVDKISQHICSGGATSYDEYKNRTGYLQAIADVLAICEEVESSLYNDNPLKSGS